MILLVSCENKVEPEFISSDITGADFGKDFNLEDHAGEMRSLADFKDKVVVIFFGYTQCPDMCPATMGVLANTMKKLGNNAEQVQVLFVSLDLARDKPAILEQYVTSFDSSFIGLTGDEETVRSMAKDFKVHYQNTSDNQAVDHSTGTYIFDTAGNIRLYIGYGNGEDIFLHDIRLLLKSS